jgi:hypothetical protein
VCKRSALLYISLSQSVLCTTQLNYARGGRCLLLMSLFGYNCSECRFGAINDRRLRSPDCCRQFIVGCKLCTLVKCGRCMLWWLFLHVNVNCTAFHHLELYVFSLHAPYRPGIRSPARKHVLLEHHFWAGFPSWGANTLIGGLQALVPAPSWKATRASDWFIRRLTVTSSKPFSQSLTCAEFSWSHFWAYQPDLI